MNLTTPSHKIWPFRATGAEDTLLDLTTAGDFASKPSTGVVDFTADSIAWTDNSIERSGTTHDLEANGIEIFMAGFRWQKLATLLQRTIGSIEMRTSATSGVLKSL